MTAIRISKHTDGDGEGDAGRGGKHRRYHGGTILRRVSEAAPT